MAMLLARMPWNQSGAACRTALVALCLAAGAGTVLAEHTKDSLDTVKKSPEAKKGKEAPKAQPPALAMKQFLDEKTFRPGLQSYKRKKSPKAD